MDWLTFIAAITKALAWPTTIALVVVILRRQLRNLFGDLRGFKYKDFEVSFGLALEQAASQADKAGLPALAPQSEALSLPLGSKERFGRLAEISPRAAILEAWLDIEPAIRDVAERHHLPRIANERTTGAVSEISAELFRQGILSHEDVMLFGTLRMLRNKSLHDTTPEITVEQAHEFRSLALRFIDEMKRR